MVGGGVGRPPPAPLNWGSTTSCTQLTPHSAGGLRQLEEGGPRPPGIQPGRAPATVPGDGPGRRGPAVRIRLLDMARRWLRPELRSADGVVELVTLERFIDGLPGETANWVRCHRPTGLAAAVTLAEDHMALYPRGQSQQQQQQQQQGRADSAPRRRALPRSLPPPLSSSLPRAQTPSFSRNNPFFSVSPAPGSVAAGFDPESSSVARTGVLAVRTTGSPAPRVPAHGGGAGGSCCRPAHLHSRPRRSVLYSVSLGFLKVRPEAGEEDERR
ncbi:zinc finger protein with KRAB and SCAN domains 7-like isoform X2 [Anguilla anguilla]|uniref:zinc finger protein with KRAB and SCAN domains 7-like isoform X2 n=1 Tax=Anguilla anguilla TaxID=7936 RepID=UPI0015AAE8B6|nr:zinc finger protein with KRAB and SCAN domains 7-like isoform X2 [Anguilla anguilla]